MNVWRDNEDLLPGEDRRAAIRSAISEGAIIFLACFSPDSLARTRSRQNEELALIIDEMRMRPASQPWIIPIRLGDCEIPDLDIGGGRTLRSIERADIFGASTETGIQRLITAVCGLLELKVRTSCPDPAVGGIDRKSAKPGEYGSPGREHLRPESRAVVIGGNNYGVVSTGDNAAITQAHDRE